jgi:PAS domain S-box-containing protein
MSQPAILLVEDNAITRKLVRFALENHGFTVVEAPDGASALRVFAEQPIALVLQDLVLPDIDGIELLRQLRALPGGTEAPMLAVSGLLTVLEEARVSSVGFDDVISKPVEPSRLLQIVRAHLPSAELPRDRFGEGRRLVLVDDDPVQRKLAAFRLQKVGFEVVAATDGIEALEVARSRPPDVIVSDVLMPRLDGFGLCVEVRKDPRLARTAIILVTNSYVESADRDLARRAGANDLLLRTPELKDLLETLRSALRGPVPVARTPTAADADVEGERMRRMMKQLDRQVALAAGVAQRSALLSAQLSVLSGISEALTTRHDIGDSLRLVLAACFDAGGISMGALYLARGDDYQVIRFGAPSAWTERDLAGFFGERALLDDCIRAQSVMPIPSADLHSERAQAVLAQAGAAAVLVAPLGYKGEPLGALLMASRTTELHSEDRLLFAQAVAGQISQALALARAFDDKDASERAARGQAAVLNSIVESVAEGVVVADEEGQFLVWNRAAEAIMGPATTRLGPDGWPRDLRGPDRETPIHADEVPLVRAMRGESVDRMELFVQDERVWLSANARPLRDENGAVRGGVMVLRDVTAEKAAQAQLMTSDRMASVGMLAAGVAHEINNPLAAVLANLDLALEAIAGQAVEPDPLIADLKESITSARAGAMRVRQIAGDLRIFSRPNEDEKTAVDVQRVLDSTLRMAWNEIRHRARLVKEYGPVPPVLANESRLGQVFLNLIVNAAQALTEGRADQNQITVTTSMNPGGLIRVAIADTGVGMSPAVMNRLFTPFFTTKPIGVGTGLGLTICQRLVQSMGGEIRVDSAIGRGTVFHVDLPPMSGEASPEPPRARKPIMPVRRGRILVIDDEAVIAHAVGRLLSTEHDVRSLTSAEEGLALIAAGDRFDIIICDLMMPVMTGMDLHRRVSEIAPDQAACMIFLTGGAFTGNAREFLDAVPNLRIDKPFDVDHLRSLVNQRIA